MCANTDRYTKVNSRERRLKDTAPILSCSKAQQKELWTNKHIEFHI